MSELVNYREYLLNKYKIEMSKYPSFIKDILNFRNKKKTYRSMVYYNIGRKKHYIDLSYINARLFFDLITTLVQNHDNENHDNYKFHFYTEKSYNRYVISAQVSSYTVNNKLSTSANLYITKYLYSVDKMKTDLHTELQISVTKTGIKAPVISVYMKDYARGTYYNNAITDQSWFDSLGFYDPVFDKKDIKEIFSIVYLELIRKLLED